MDKSGNSKSTLLNDIKKQLNLLEDAFYDGIPNDLLKDAHLTNFRHMMNVIHSRIITLVKKNTEHENYNIAAATDTSNNINFAQLAALSKRDISNTNADTNANAE